MNIYVGNLPRSTNEEAVRQLFEQFGDVREVKLIKDHETGELRGFGFVEMPSMSEAEQAIEGINGNEMEGRTLVVNKARRKNERPGGGNRRGGGGGGNRGNFHGRGNRSW